MTINNMVTKVPSNVNEHEIVISVEQPKNEYYTDSDDFDNFDNSDDYNSRLKKISDDYNIRLKKISDDYNIILEKIRVIECFHEKIRVIECIRVMFCLLFLWVILLLLKKN